MESKFDEYLIESDLQENEDEMWAYIEKTGVYAYWRDPEYCALMIGIGSQSQCGRTSVLQHYIKPFTQLMYEFDCKLLEWAYAYDYKNRMRWYTQSACADYMANVGACKLLYYLRTCWEEVWGVRQCSYVEYFFLFLLNFDKGFRTENIFRLQLKDAHPNYFLMPTSIDEEINTFVDGVLGPCPRDSIRLYGGDHLENLRKSPWPMPCHLHKDLGEFSELGSVMFTCPRVATSWAILKSPCPWLSPPSVVVHQIKKKYVNECRTCKWYKNPAHLNGLLELAKESRSFKWMVENEARYSNNWKETCNKGNIHLSTALIVYGHTSFQFIPPKFETNMYSFQYVFNRKSKLLSKTDNCILVIK